MRVFLHKLIRSMKKQSHMFSLRESLVYFVQRGLLGELSHAFCAPCSLQLVKKIKCNVIGK